MTEQITIKPKERDALIQSLRAGVVPRVGQHLIQVGRSKELESMLNDIDRISDNGSCFRFIIGEYGAGKTFFLNLVRAMAMERKLVTMHADLNPDRRLHASGGQARSLYAELTRNISTRTKPDGGALTSIVEKFITTAIGEAREQGKEVSKVIHDKLEHFHEMVNGFDFAEVITAYYQGYDSGNDKLKEDAIRWLRGEFSTKTDAKNALGVRSYVDDASVYDQLKLLAKFVKLAGYNGLMICLDEMVNIYKVANTGARNANYEQILRMLNDTLQGTSEGIGFVMGGTPEFLMDTRRGLYSYSALQSRLAENTYVKNGLVDYTGPVLKLASLTPEEMFVLLQKIKNVYAYGDPSKELVPDEGITSFMHQCSSKLGDKYFRTPRNTITAFVNLLAVLDQNPETKWESIVGTLDIKKDADPDVDVKSDSVIDTTHQKADTNSVDSVQNKPKSDENEFASFKL